MCLNILSLVPFSTLLLLVPTRLLYVDNLQSGFVVIALRLRPAAPLAMAWLQPPLQYIELWWMYIVAACAERDLPKYEHSANGILVSLGTVFKLQSWQC
jgi:hypothetical protein